MRSSRRKEGPSRQNMVWVSCGIPSWFFDQADTRRVDESALYRIHQVRDVHRHDAQDQDDVRSQGLVEPLQVHLVDGLGLWRRVALLSVQVESGFL